MEAVGGKADCGAIGQPESFEQESAEGAETAEQSLLSLNARVELFG